MGPSELKRILDEGAALLPAPWDSARSRVALTAIALQESRLAHRRQLGNGPARGLWQFEEGGGVRGVVNFATTRAHVATVCAARGIDATTPAVYSMLEHDDVLACCFARMLLYTDPRPLPAVGNVDATWAYYIRNWRPGKPHPSTWSAQYAKALDLLAAAA